MAAFGDVVLSADDPPLLIATGGFAHLFRREQLFDHVVSDLILTGLLEALRLNGYLDHVAEAAEQA